MRASLASATAGRAPLSPRRRRSVSARASAKARRAGSATAAGVATVSAETAGSETVISTRTPTAALAPEDPTAGAHTAPAASRMAARFISRLLASPTQTVGGREAEIGDNCHSLKRESHSLFTHCS